MPPGKGPRQPSDGDRNGNGQQSGFKLPFSSQQLSYAVVALAAVSAVLLLDAVRQSVVLAALEHGMDTVMESLSGMADGPSTRDSVAALKRLLREVFAEQLTIKQRLSDAEKAASAAAQLEAADDYQLRQAVSSSSNWDRAPVRMSGHITAAGVLPWSQEAQGAEGLSMLSGLGVTGAAHAVLQLHSVLANGKRRVTAEFCQAAQEGSAAALRLHRLLFRVQAKSWLKLMIAPLGGSLEALGRSITPVRGDYGCTQALQRGHGLTVLQQQGSGKAVSLTSRSLAASAGMFVGGACKTGVAQLQARSQDGHSLTLIAAHSRPKADSTHAETDGSASTSSGQPPGKQGMRFLGVQSPSSSANNSSQQQPLSGPVLGAAGVLPLGDVVTATAWTEKPASGSAGWGIGLYCQPDDEGLELGMALGKVATQQERACRPLFCELSAKVPVGDGLSISPCALLTTRRGATSFAYVMQSCWRW